MPKLRRDLGMCHGSQGFGSPLNPKLSINERKFQFVYRELRVSSLRSSKPERPALDGFYPALTSVAQPHWPLELPDRGSHPLLSRENPDFIQAFPKIRSDHVPPHLVV